MGSNVIYLAERVPSYRRRLPDICAPVSALPSPAPNGAWAAMARERAARRQASLHEEAALPAASGGGQMQAAPVLRVTRLAEGAGRSLGRLRISGRLIDVCAELDRLAAVEAA